MRKYNPIAIALGYTKDQLTTNIYDSAFHFHDQIINDINDNDLYKINMMYAIFKNFLDSKVKVKFKCRTDEDLGPIFDVVKSQIMNLKRLRFNESQIQALRNKAPYCDEAFFGFLKNFTLDCSGAEITRSGKNNLEIEISGSWFDKILFEILVLAIVSEVRNVYLHPNATMVQFRSKLTAKIKKIKKLKKDGIIDDDFKFADFGTRRRCSSKVHEYLVSTMLSELPEHFVGTSNIRLAQENGIPAIGTQAHEWFQGCQAQEYRLIDSQKMALEVWAQTFRGELGIALTDCISMSAFVKDFDKYFAKLFDGLRHDSGCPFKWAEMAIKAYEDNGIDPTQKTLVFSDGLDFDKAVEIYCHFKGRIKMSFGIGTFLTCDMDIEGFKALNIVMKLVMVNGSPVIKLSDSEGKSMCEDEGYASYVKTVFDYENRVKI